MSDNLRAYRQKELEGRKRELNLKNVAAEESSMLTDAEVKKIMARRRTVRSQIKNL